jgi:hypothetical protein
MVFVKIQDQNGVQLTANITINSYFNETKKIVGSFNRFFEEALKFKSIIDKLSRFSALSSCFPKLVENDNIEMAKQIGQRMINELEMQHTEIETYEPKYQSVLMEL